MILKIFLPKQWAKILSFFTQNKAKLWKKLIITLVLKKAPNLCRKLSKIAENCDHNIDPYGQICRMTRHFYFRREKVGKQNKATALTNGCSCWQGQIQCREKQKK
jgi:hypothetical protein